MTDTRAPAFRKTTAGKQAAGMAALRRILPAAVLCGALVLGGCQSSGGDSGGSTLKNFLLYGGATVPPEMEVPAEEVICPRFDVFEGGSAVRSGEGRELRHQLAIRTTARECITHADGTHTVNVGVEVLALLGPAGRPGTFSTPLHIAIRRNNTVLATRTRQVSVTIPAGEAQALTRIVEEGLPLPEDTSGVLIQIGLGALRR
ncbi:MAG: hypothetical protein ACOYJQ_01745 [Pseudochelatococcus sp.]|jgi:hypothetical protein|uniref:hypothetical protein n=1 Tax=Pseudochelatococcus sp. TaxID=2020869 RepID=UPI003D8F17BA